MTEIMYIMLNMSIGIVFFTSDMLTLIVACMTCGLVGAIVNVNECKAAALKIEVYV